MTKTKFLAYYLPQFHSIPENDKWWGKGFTEWTNVRKAVPLYNGHRQPRVPSELGYYNLLDPEVMIRQSNMAQQYGIDGFAYWHYWFGGGKRLLEKPSQLMLDNKEITIPFCFAWANQTWTGIWHGLDNKVLMAQEYPGMQDAIEHFYEVLPFFNDARYIKIDNRPVFIIYKPLEHPFLQSFTDLWQSLALKNGFDGVHFIGVSYSPEMPAGLQAIALQQKYFLQKPIRFIDGMFKRIIGTTLSEYLRQTKYGCNRHDFSNVIQRVANEDFPTHCYPTILTGWDNTPRSGRRGVVLENYDPDSFELMCKTVVEKLRVVKAEFCMVKSWNEWAEGNYLEPDEKYGRKFLEVFSNARRSLG